MPLGDAFKPQLQERLRQPGPGGRADQQFRPAGGGELHQDSRRRLVQVVGVVDDQQQGLLGGTPLLASSWLHSVRRTASWEVASCTGSPR